MCYSQKEEVMTLASITSQKEFYDLWSIDLIVLYFTLQVKEKSSVGKVVIDEIAEFIQESYPNKESGIVYCFSRKECEQVCLIMAFF